MTIATAHPVTAEPPAAQTPYAPTPDDVLRQEDEALYELVDGQLVEKQMGAIASRSATKLAATLERWAENQDAGSVFVEATYQCFPFAEKQVRRPDISFVSRQRLAPEHVPAGHITVAPDLAVEVISPNDQIYEVDRKVADYFRAGVKLIWIVNPEQRTIRVHHPSGRIDQIAEPAELIDDSDVLPGFRCALADIFTASASQPNP